MLGADWALDEQRRLNKKNEYFQSNLTYDNLQGQGGLFALRTFAQQFPNIALAITTAGAGSYAQLGNIGTRLAIGGAFGASSGAQTFRDLTLQQELVEKAFEQKEFLEQGFEDGEITYFPYIQGMLDANKAIAMNDLTDDQIIGAAIASGTIEGSITAALGTAPNAIKIFKDFKGGINLVDLYAKTKKSQIAAILGEGTKRVGVEVAEELLIYGAQGVITEIGILNREFKADQFDDIAITTIMVAGASNGPGVAYSGINNMIYTNEFAKKVNKSNEQIEELNKLIADPKVDDDLKSLAIEQIGTELGVQAKAINVNAVAFDRTVKLQFDSGDVFFNAISLNQNSVYSPPSQSLVMEASKTIDISDGTLIGYSISGGQCQRIAVARSLYRSSPILILDEATNALDEKTELNVIKNICSINGLTLILISHNLKLLEFCDYNIDLLKLNEYNN